MIVHASKTNLIFQGRGYLSTIIAWNDTANSTGGTPYSASTSIFALNFTAYNISFQVFSLVKKKSRIPLPPSSEFMPFENFSFMSLNQLWWVVIKWYNYLTFVYCLILLVGDHITIRMWIFLSWFALCGSKAYIYKYVIDWLEQLLQVYNVSAQMCFCRKL